MISVDEVSFNAVDVTVWFHQIHWIPFFIHHQVRPLIFFQLRLPTPTSAFQLFSTLISTQVVQIFPLPPSQTLHRESETPATLPKCLRVLFFFFKNVYTARNMYKTRLWLERNMNYINFFTRNRIKTLNFLNYDYYSDFFLSCIYSESGQTFNFISTQKPHSDSKA